MRKSGEISTVREGVDLVIAKAAYFLLGNIADEYLVFSRVRKLSARLITNVRLAVLRCGVPIPPKEMAEIDGIKQERVADFLEFAASV